MVPCVPISQSPESMAPWTIEVHGPMCERLSHALAISTRCIFSVLKMAPTVMIVVGRARSALLHGGAKTLCCETLGLYILSQ